MRGVLIDLDGTLVDSSNGIYSSFLHAVSGFGLACPTKDEFKMLIGPPMSTIVNKLYPGITNQTVRTIVSKYRLHYDFHGFSNYCVYEGVSESLRLLSDIFAGQLAVVTNKPSAPALQILKDADIDSYFLEIVGIDYRVVANTGLRFCSKSDAIRFSLDLLGWVCSDSMYIGDTLLDKQECYIASIPFIAATYGFGHWTQYNLGGCSKISKFSEIFEFV